MERLAVEGLSRVTVDFDGSVLSIEQGVTLKLIHHAARLQGNGTTLSGIVTSRR